MYRFVWVLPSAASEEHILTLEMRSRMGWIGRKVLTLDGRRLFSRGWFDGVHHRFALPGGGDRFVLDVEKTGQSNQWQPVLSQGGRRIEETTATLAPHTPRRPAFLAIVVGTTFLMMFMMFIMWAPIEKILTAAYAHADSRTYILKVANGEQANGDLRQVHERPPAASVGRPYDFQLAAEGGTPPYTWRRIKGRMPPVLTFDPQTGRVHGTPRESGETVVQFEVRDANDQVANWPLVLRVADDQAADPRITIDALPPARVGEPYDATITASGGQPPYQWIINKRKLPRGLEFSEVAVPSSGGDQPSIQAARIQGTPRPPENGGDEVAPTVLAYPLQVRVADSAYSARQATQPWFVPFLVTALCLIGYWNMRRITVWIFGLAWVGQLAAGLAGGLPIAFTPMLIQVALMGLGAAYYRRMH